MTRSPFKKAIFSFGKILTLVFVLMIHSGFAQIPERPSPQRLYNNLSKEFPEFLSVSEAAQLEDKLDKFSKETSNQICVVVVDDLGGYEASEFATQLGQKWGVGQGKFNNGVVILIKPSGGEGQRDLFIAVGYGLEGAIPDITTKKIREEEMYPYFARGEYYTAIDRATTVLMKLAKGEINSKEYGGSGAGGFVKKNWIAIIVIIILIFIFFGRGGGGTTYGRSGRYYGGGFGGGGFGGGGSSGGGFGGFGGGSFGGGGSGGKW
ncbi:MAG: TPM domain-containing protein [Bacteroidia bacterium]